MISPILACWVLAQAPPAVGNDFNRQLASVHRPFQSAIQQAVSTTVKEKNLVGATVVVVVDGKLQAAVAAGARKVGDPTPLQVTDPMHSGSNTKGMTALLAGRLVEKGKVRWDTTLREGLGTREFMPHPDIQNVPLFELFYQRLPLPDVNVHLPRYTQVSLTEGRKRLAEDYLGQAPTNTAGQKMEYRSANFIALGALLERAAGSTYEELMRREVFGPLSMRSAGFGAMGTGKDVTVPWQHFKKDGKWQPIYHDNPVYGAPAGAVHLSALDLANYAYARIVGSLGDRSFLSQASWRILNSPPTGSSYAGGISTGKQHQPVPDMSHGGSNNLSCSNWWVRDSGRILVVAMLNSKSSEELKTLLEEILQLTRQWMQVNQ